MVSMEEEQARKWYDVSAMGKGQWWSSGGFRYVTHSVRTCTCGHVYFTLGAPSWGETRTHCTQSKVQIANKPRKCVHYWFTFSGLEKKLSLVAGLTCIRQCLISRIQQAIPCHLSCTAWLHSDKLLVILHGSYLALQFLPLAAEEEAPNGHCDHCPIKGQEDETECHIHLCTNAST